MCTITLTLAKRGEAIPGPYSSLTCFAGVRPGAVPERGEIGGHRHRRARWSIHSGQRRLHAHEPRSCSRLSGEARDRLWRSGSRPRISTLGKSADFQPTKLQQSSLRLEVLECRNGGPAASPIWRLRRAAWARHPGRMRAAVSRDRWAPLGSPRAAELQWRHRNGCPSSAPAPGLPK